MTFYKTKKSLFMIFGLGYFRDYALFIPKEYPVYLVHTP